MITKEEAREFLKLFEEADQKLEKANDLFAELEETLAESVVVVRPLYEKIKTIAEKRSI